MFEKLATPEQVRRFRGAMPISHRYTAGRAGERFFRALKDRGVLLATRCAACGVVYCPARAFCERCLAPLQDYHKVGPGSSLQSFTIVHRGLDEEPLEDPVLVGLIRIDGADTCLVHRIADADRAALHIGMRVEPILKPAQERVGGLDDIDHFRPVGGAPPALH